MAICFHCGRNTPAPTADRSVGGNPVKLHARCAKRFDAERTTARATTTPTGEVYVDDNEHYSADGLCRAAFSRGPRGDLC